jgi:hypothetical protein
MWNSYYLKQKLKEEHGQEANICLIHKLNNYNLTHILQYVLVKVQFDNDMFSKRIFNTYLLPILAKWWKILQDIHYEDF